MTVSVKPPPALKKKTLSLKQTKLAISRLGAAGETLVLEYLLSLEWQILAQNVFSPPLEVDLVALDLHAQEIVVVEVKTRSSVELLEVENLISWRKKRSFAKHLPNLLKNLHTPSWPFRVDLLVVTGDTVHQFKNVSGEW